VVLGKKYWGVIQMSVDIKQIGDMKIKVVSEDDSISYKDIISDQDAEMDRRAIAAVRSAIEKAKVCNKPIAKFDVETKRAYLEYPDGSREYAN
jgi:hypothetical protein